MQVAMDQLEVRQLEQSTKKDKAAPRSTPESRNRQLFEVENLDQGRAGGKSSRRSLLASLQEGMFIF